MTTAQEFAQFLFDNPKGMDACYDSGTTRPVVSAKVAQEAIRILLKNGVETKKVVKRCLHRDWGNDLLKVIADYSSVKKSQLIEILAKIPDAWWEEYFSIEKAGEICGHNLVPEIIKVNRKKFLNGTHPLYNYLSSERVQEYWIKRVGWYIAKKDYRRAFDELKKAHRGFVVETPTNPFDPETGRYWGGAHKRSIATIATNLFRAMVNDNIIPPLPSGDEYVLESTWERGVRYVGSRIDETNQEVAGLELARMFLIRDFGFNIMTRKRISATYSIPGGMILQMARFFADQKAKNRQEKWKKRSKKHS